MQILDRTLRADGHGAIKKFLIRRISSTSLPKPDKALLQVVIDRENEKGREARSRKREKALNARTTVSAKALLGLWAGECRASFPEEPSRAFTTTDGIVLQGECRRHFGRGANSPEFLPFMEWSIRNWRNVVAMKFSGMTDPPMYPAPRFFVKCVGRFLDAYQDARATEQMASMTTREQMIFRLVRKGTDQATAEREVDERLGLTRLRQEIEDERKKLQRLQRQSAQFQETEERLKLMERRAQRREGRSVTGEDDGDFGKWI